MQRIETTINNICDWIEEQLKNTSSMQTESVLPEMISALADLVIAQGEFYH